jgi:hypothetical protein
MDPKEFLRRNLVVDSASVDGITIRIDDLEPATPDDVDMLRAFPSFSPDTWLESEFNERKSEILSATQSRNFGSLELQQRLDHLRDRCDSTQIPSESNPLRAWQEANEVRREIACLLQAIAEERIRIRELGAGLRQRNEKWTSEWRDELSMSISQSIPNPKTLAHLFVKNCVKKHLNSFREILSVATVLTQPLGEMVSRTRGTDVSIPGLPRSYTLIRAASLTGQLETNSGNRFPFRAKLTGIGDENSPANPKSEWRFERTGFEPFGGERGKAIVVSVRTSTGFRVPCQAATLGCQELAWVDPALPHAALNSASDSTSHLRWSRGEQGDSMEVAFPVVILLQTQPSVWSEWQLHWDRMVQRHRGERLVASWRTASCSMEPKTDPWRCQGIELHPDTAALAEEIGEETRALFVDGVLQRLQPRISDLVSAIDLFLDQTWSTGTQQHLNALDDMERDANWLRARCKADKK